MNSKTLVKNSFLKTWFNKRLNYYAKGFFVYKGGVFERTTDKFYRVIIVAKCHYTESWKSFSGINKKDLQLIIKLQKSSMSDSEINKTIQIFENKNIDGFDVKEISFDKELNEIFGTNKILIPETELFTNTNSNNKVMALETPAGKLFCSVFNGKVTSAYANGVFNNIDNFMLSAGVAENTVFKQVENKNYSKFIVEQIYQQQLYNFFNKVSFRWDRCINPNRVHFLYWGPLLAASLFYIVINGYLWVKSESIRADLLADNSNVRHLVKEQQKQNYQVKVVNFINNRMGDEGPDERNSRTHDHWFIFYELINEGMTISKVTFTDGFLSIRGEAEKASDILSIISKNDNVSSVSFDGAVRKSDGVDSFVLKININNI